VRRASQTGREGGGAKGEICIGPQIKGPPRFAEGGHKRCNFRKWYEKNSNSMRKMYFTRIFTGSVQVFFQKHFLNFFFKYLEIFFTPSPLLDKIFWEKLGAPNLKFAQAPEFIWEALLVRIQETLRYLKCI
jgi:hypothetical protein